MSGLPPRSSLWNKIKKRISNNSTPNKNEQMNIEWVKTTDIHANENNPRILKDDKFKKLVQSIKDFPEMLEIRPIVVNNEMMILGGNMRWKAIQEIGIKEIPIIKAENLTEEQEREFLIKDNVGFGEWDWDALANDWDYKELNDWALDLPKMLDPEQFGEDFSLADGDKSPFQQMSFTLADEQATQIKNAIADIKLTEEYKYMETLGNENSNGNALYLIIMQWAEQKK
jgi:hypothetical protein